MAIIAAHPVPGSTATIRISQLVKGFLITSMGDPRLQTSCKAKNEADAREKANALWREQRDVVKARAAARAPQQPAAAPRPTPAQIAADFAEERKWDDAIAEREIAQDRAVAAAKAMFW